MRGSAGKMLAPKPDNLIIDPWNQCSKRGELTSYKLSSDLCVHAVWYVCCLPPPREIIKISNG